MQNSEYQEVNIVDFVIVKRQRQKYQIAAIDEYNNVVYNLPLTTFENAVEQQAILKRLWNL